jgi:ATP-binding cassette subfamily B (MDR/TAP) protein 1
MKTKEHPKPEKKDGEPIKADGEIVNQQPEKKKPDSFFKIQLFQATCWDYFIMIAGICASMGVGTAQPLFAWLYGSILNDIGAVQRNPVLLDRINILVLKLYMFSIGQFIAGFLMISLWIYNGRITSERIRSHYFRTILKQEQGWFDSTIPYEFSTKVQGQITKIDNGLGEKVSNIIMNIAQVITGYVIAFSTSWKLSLVIFSLFPIFMFAGIFISKATMGGMIRNRVAYEKAGGIAEEVLYHIKTVASFSNFEYEKNRFGEKIEETYKAGSDTSLKTGIGIAIFFFGFYMNFAISIGYGGLINSLQQIKCNNSLL